MFTIDRDSEAGRQLEHAFKRDNLYKVSLALRPALDSYVESVAVKVNEDIWSLPLTIVSDGQGNYDPTMSGSVTGLECCTCGRVDR